MFEAVEQEDQEEEVETADTVQSGDWCGRAGEARRVLDLRAGVTVPHMPVKITRWVDI